MINKREKKRRRRERERRRKSLRTLIKKRKYKRNIKKMHR